MVADIVAEGVQYMALALGGGIASFNFMHIAIPKLFDRADTDSAAAYDRWKLGRAERFGQQIAQVAAERKLDRPTKEAPASVLHPLIEAAILEEDEDLSVHWAQMFVNATDANSKAEVRRAYISIFQDCTRLDVQILGALDSSGHCVSGATVRSALLPDQVLPFYASDMPAISKLPNPEVVRSLWNLIRLGLVSPENTHGGDKRLLFVALTSLGVGLVEACTSPREA